MPLNRPNDPRRLYPERMGACIAAALLVLIGLFRWWPAGSGMPPPPRIEAGEQERIRIEDVRPTRQASDRRPPPPAPPPPVVVPDEMELEYQELDLSLSALPTLDPGDGGSAGDGPGSGPAEAPEAPLVGPRPIRFVEPEYTREARRKRIKAEIVVEVTVDEQGRASAPRVIERYLIPNGLASKEPVPSVGYGLEDSARAAALLWKFRPAHRGGKPVPSSTVLTFRFGV